jgi:hypothetical protein
MKATAPHVSFKRGTALLNKLFALARKTAFGRQR